MIKHIVLWKLDDSYSSDEKLALSLQIKEKLESLVGKIDELKSLEVGINSPEAPASNFDVCLDSTFDSIETLNAYQVHEEHVKVAGFIKSLNLSRSAIDYQY